MFLIVTVPVILGMLLRKFSSGVALKLEPIAKKISIILFVLVLLGAIAAERENVISYFAQAGLITLILNVVMMIVAYYVAQTCLNGYNGSLLRSSCRFDSRRDHHFFVASLINSKHNVCININ